MQILGFNFSVKKQGVSAKVESSKSQGKKNPAIIKIVETFKDSSRKDIDKWRSALQMTKNIEEPKFNAYHDLIDDLMTDGHLQSQVQMRKLSTLNTDYRVINRKTGVENEDLNFIFQQQWFYKLLDNALDVILRGPAVIEFLGFNNEKIEINPIPRRNVVPTRGKIFPDVTKPDFINYWDEAFAPWLIQMGENADLGIINNIIPNLIWKRNVMQAWAEFCEKFGMPLITATTNSADASVIDNVHEMLLSLGEASVGTFPPGTDIKFQEANRTDAYNVYMQFRKSNDDEISKMLVGSTMLSDQGSNRAQTEVHERSLDNRISQADKRLIQFVINDQLFPLLKLQGYNIGDDDFFEFKTAEQEINLTQLWDITEGLLTSGFEVEQDWISKTFNIPIEGKKKIEQPAINVAASYLPENRPRYEFTCTCGNHVQAVGKPSQDKINQFSEDLAKYIFDGEDTLGIEGDLISEEANTLLGALRGNFKTFNPYVGPDHLALQMMEYNLFEFSASKTESRLAAMKELLIDYDKKELRDFASFKSEAEKITKDFNTQWLQAEYNLSVAVGQTSAQYVQFMAEKDSVTSFVEYQTVGDDKVRESHQILDGKIFSLDDKEAMKLWPPNGYGCRCEMLQYLGSTKGKVTTGLRGQELIHSRDPKYKSSQFEINRGDLKQVFTDKQFYSTNKGLDEKINKMTYDKYGLEKFDDLKKGLKPIKIDKSITGDNVKELFKAVKDKTYMGFSDYLGRKMILPEKTFDTHTKGHYLTKEEQRHQLFPHIEDILNNPDEVWLNERNKGKFNSHYIKFYGDRAVIVNVHLNNQMEGLEIQTWYNLKRDDAKERLGIKIK
ncbi:phage portal protein family protein [Epilithonimonas mollis]|uniref:Phage putative head morphogenesis protein, SPP1 gp7 family n=1 Tax=Epilithonimonas mollis TaxID=216903 RepID=A0A1M6UK85_9FLAO|nr:DUF935 family protein [Epilithonimonas mollis]SHK69591.1 phage putative head morphogenesis protein, SPP1 gp7 family [Epilithonimonas mollis]